MVQEVSVQKSKSTIIREAAKEAALYIEMSEGTKWPEPIKPRFQLLNLILVYRRKSGWATYFDDQGSVELAEEPQTFIRIGGTRYWLSQSGMIYRLHGSTHNTYLRVDRRELDSLSARYFASIMSWLKSPDY